MKVNKYLLIFGLGLLSSSLTTDKEEETKLSQPNIVYILADDMGIGDIRILNPEAKVATPNLDELFRAGMTFTDAHTAAAVCTPTRYGLLTGRYPWRTQLKRGVLRGDSRPLIENNIDTAPALLRRQGYHTAMIGKWHLGWDWAPKAGMDFQADPNDYYKNLGDAEKMIDFSKPFTGGPVDHGFDYYFGINASLDFPPYVYLENDKALLLPTERQARQGKRNDYPEGKENDLEGAQMMIRSGSKAPGFLHEEVLLTLTEKAADYITNYQEPKPFFLYVSLTAPHTPVVPRATFQGTSEAGRYGDHIQELDWSVGKVMEALKAKGLMSNTLIIFTADNGASKISFPLEFEEKYGHYPSRELQGRKGSLHEGGHRVPFVAVWPDVISPGTKCDKTISLNDLYATCAAIAEEEISSAQGVDSYSMLNLLKGENDYARKTSVYNDFGGRLALREGQWKLILHPRQSQRRLYNLADDLEEKHNLYMEEEYQAQIAIMMDKLTAIIKNGRSTEGPLLANDGPLIWQQLYWLK
jgi:arylsulfatase A-like enzyme